MPRIKREQIKNKKDVSISRGEYLRQQLEKVKSKEIKSEKYSPHKVLSAMRDDDTE